MYFLENTDTKVLKNAISVLVLTESISTQTQLYQWR